MCMPGRMGRVQVAMHALGMAEQGDLAVAQGKRGALPSSTIMLRQPMQRFTQMQASDIDIYRNELRKTKNEIVSALSWSQLTLLLCCTRS